MSDYRRLISYIYEYEGKNKGKNVGFVKLETRNGQCRLNVNVKKIYVGGNAIGVFLLGKGQAETFLGNLFVRGGNGEFRVTVDAANVESSGNGLDTYYGLAVHDVKNPWRSYKTIWDDALAPQNEAGEAAGNDTAKQMAQEVLPERKENPQSVSDVVKEIEAEINQEAERRELEEQPMQHAAEIGLAGGDGPVELEEEAAEAGPEMPSGPEAQPQPEMPSGPEVQPQPEMPSGPEAQPQPEVPSGPEAQPEMPSGPDVQPQPEMPSGPDVQPQPEMPSGPAARPEMQQRPEEQPKAEAPSPLQSPELENPEVLKYLQEAENKTSDPEKLWAELRKSYPKIQAFDYADGCEILTVHPQDIGRLPRENWVFGNNSFLLHGYYNFRYLILVRLGNKNGAPRYLIGVPGHYFSNEKYMASMFGFPNFVLSKKQPRGDGRFGYWYTDLRLR